MQNFTDKDFVKIPVLSDDELMELADLMNTDYKDELSEIRFWKKVYTKRGLNYKRRR